MFWALAVCPAGSDCVMDHWSRTVAWELGELGKWFASRLSTSGSQGTIDHHVAMAMFPALSSFAMGIHPWSRAS